MSKSWKQRYYEKRELLTDDQIGKLDRVYSSELMSVASYVTFRSACELIDRTVRNNNKLGIRPEPKGWFDGGEDA